MKKKEPFRTQERQLAFALMCAGCRFAADVDDGPAINVYSLGYMRQDRFAKYFNRKDPKTGREIKVGIEDAAQALIDKKIPGIVTYLFVRDATFDEAIAAWDGIAESLTEADQTNTPPELPKISAKVTAQVMCIAANNMEVFQNVPFMNKARQMVSTVTGSTRHDPILNPRSAIDGQAELPGKRDVTTGLGKAWTIGATQGLKEKLGVTV